MKAFVEWLPADARVGIIRAGPEATEYGRNYDFAAVLVVSNGVAEICALTKDAEHSLRREHVEAAINAIRRECNLLPRWRRIKGDRRMALPRTSHARHQDGSHDHSAFEDGAHEWLRAIRRGDVTDVRAQDVKDANDPAAVAAAIAALNLGPGDELFLAAGKVKA